MITCPICKTKYHKHDLKLLESDCHFLEIEGVNQHLIRYQCNVCDVIFGPEDMLNLKPEKLSKFYQDVYATNYREMDSSDFELSLLYMLHPDSSKTYINWGAGTSNTSEKAKAKGFSLLNYDPGMPDTLNYLSKETLPKADGIISNNVLDHLQDPIADLLFMKSLLNPGGSMIHASDGFRYALHFTKAHLFFFVGKSVDFISKAIGMSYTTIPAEKEGTDIVEWKVL